jgi:hypothetical protein
MTIDCKTRFNDSVSPRCGKEDMLAQERQLMVVRDAIDVVLRHLECLPTSDRAEQLRAWVQDWRQETEQWRASPPTAREREGLMIRLLAVHIAVTKIERDAVLAVGKSADSLAAG